MKTNTNQEGHEVPTITRMKKMNDLREVEWALLQAGQARQRSVGWGGVWRRAAVVHREHHELLVERRRRIRALRPLCGVGRLVGRLGGLRGGGLGDGGLGGELVGLLLRLRRLCLRRRSV